MKFSFRKLAVASSLFSCFLFAEEDLSLNNNETEQDLQISQVETETLKGNQELAQSGVDRDVVDQVDIEALRDWINTKRQVTVKELGGRLSISGEVRTELQSTNERKNAKRQRGSGGEVSGVPTRAYDIEVNLMLDYRADRTWAAIKLEFDNNAGNISGTFNRLTLERAFFGVRAIQGDTFTTDVELGRRRLNYTFDSRIEFGSFMDGILVKYDHALDFLGDFYIHGGPFVINEKKDQYGWVGEVGLLGLGNTGFYTKYSLIDWDTKNLHNSIENRRFQFLNSQWILGYKFVPRKWNKTVTCYAAGLLNHAATGRPLVEKDAAGNVVKKVNLTNGKKANWAAYIGFSMGEVRKVGDWSLDVNYQWVAAQSIPGFDAAGIGRGNAADVGFYTKKPDGTGGLNDRSDAVGFTNYKGLSIELLYLMTNNLTLMQGWRQSVTLDKDIGPLLRYKQYEIELIYAF
ncbi:MAG: hypothetical protein Tsb0015_05010 [Simkaniaceae bacterium]